MEPSEDRGRRLAEQMYFLSWHQLSMTHGAAKCSAVYSLSRSADLVTTAFPEDLPVGTMLQFEDLCVGLDVGAIANLTHCTKPEDRSAVILEARASSAAP